MSIPLSVNNTVFNYPTAGDPKGWGEEATAWATEVSLVLNDLKGPNDVLQSTSLILNNQSVMTDIIRLLFDPSSVRTAEISYNIVRSTNDESKNESGVITITYDAKLGLFGISQESDGDSGVVFDVTNLGQVQYSSNLLNGLNYSGIITFRAKTLDII